MKNGWEFFIEARRNMCSNQRIQHGRGPDWKKAWCSPRSRTPAQEAMGTMEDRKVEGQFSPPVKFYETGSGLTEFLTKIIKTNCKMKMKYKID